MAITRMNFTLPEDVVKILNKRVKSGEKSNFVAEAIRSHAQRERYEDIMARMIEGYIENAEDDLRSNKEWEGVQRDGLSED